jgi:hypothetical protein
MNKLKIFITLAILSLLAFEIYESFNIHNHRDEPGDLVLDNKDLRKSVDSIKNQPSLVFQSTDKNCDKAFNQVLKNITKHENATRDDYKILIMSYPCASCMENLRQLVNSTNDDKWVEFLNMDSTKKYEKYKCN